MRKCLFAHILVTVLYWIQNPRNIEACSAGHYCPPGGGEIACPKGFYNPNTGSTDYTACLPCPAGQYCPFAGSSAPYGSCGEGFYCPGRNTANNPMGRECWQHHYCPTGASVPLRCTSTSYQMEMSKSSCVSCPAGSFCMDGFRLGICYYGYHCSSGNSNPAQIPCAIGHYCVLGFENACYPGSIQPQTGQAGCEQCPVGKYCAYSAAQSVAGTCMDTYYCELGEYNAMPGGKYCTAGHKCVNGLKIECGKGFYQPNNAQTSCIKCPVGNYCPSTNTVNPIPCEQGQCCHEGFIVPKTCAQGTFIHFRTYDEVNRLTWTEAESACQGQPQFKLATIDTQEEYARLISWFKGPGSTYVTIVGGEVVLPHPIWVGAIWTAGIYKWDMKFDLVNMTWGNWKTGQNPTPTTQSCLVFDVNLQFENVPCGSKMDVLCEKSNPCQAPQYYSTLCKDCEEGKYCSQHGMFQVSGTCDDGWYCTGSASTPNQNKCNTGHYCTGGFMYPCAAGTYQPLPGSTTCNQCTPGKYCNASGLVQPVGLCEAGYYCPAGSSSPQGPCPKGHACPVGSAAPSPCPGGTYQDQAGQGFCKMCPQGMYCDTAEATAEQQSGASSSTHGVVTPKPCPTHIACDFGRTTAICSGDPYNAGAVELSLSCTGSVCSGPVSSSQDPIIVFQMTCNNCAGTGFSQKLWSYRRCHGTTINQCEYCNSQLYLLEDTATTTVTFDPRWLPFDSTGWQYFSLMVRGHLTSGLQGMAYKLWWYFDPWQGTVSCTSTPSSGTAMQTLFSISCDQVPDEEKLTTIDYTITVYNDVKYQGPAPITDLQLPEPNPADNNQLPLHLEATTNGGQFFYQSDFTVEVR